MALLSIKVKYTIQYTDITGQFSREWIQKRHFDYYISGVQAKGMKEATADRCHDRSKPVRLERLVKGKKDYRQRENQLNLK